jgi:site-specific DNA-methyltransferase (adenine-specific)
MILCDLPFGTTQSKWDNIIPFEKLWLQYKRIIKASGAIVLVSAQPFTSALVMSNLRWFRCEWVREKIKPTGHLNVKSRPLTSHENILVFSATRCVYNPQKTYGHPPLHGFKRDKDYATGVYGETKGRYTSGGTTERFPRSVVMFPLDDNQRLHPSQKPVALFEYFIKTYSNEGDLVLDNCAGSGTTGIACQNTNRNFILIEKEKKYYKVCKERGIIGRKLPK